MKKEVCIFTEGGSKQGLGHIIRCMALYDELEKRGLPPYFVINFDGNPEKILGERRYETDFWYEKIDQFHLEDGYAIVDSYHVTQAICMLLSEKCRRVLFLDDMNRMKYPSGIIVNPGIGGEAVRYDTNNGQICLQGTQYTIIRNEFRTPGTSRKNVSKNIKSILVILGGSDVCNFTGLILECLQDKQYESITKHIVIGNSFKNKLEIQREAADKSIRLHYDLNADELSKLMQECDFAISAAGQTVNELIAVALPFACIKVIDNQENNIKGLLKEGIISDYFDFCSPGTSKDSFCSWIHSAINKNIEAKTREDQIKKMASLDVKNGVSRVIDALIDG